MLLVAVLLLGVVAMVAVVAAAIVVSVVAVACHANPSNRLRSSGYRSGLNKPRTEYLVGLR